MVRRSLAIAVILLSAPPAFSQYNPGGWIEGDAWNLLLPLTHNKFCTAGGSEGLALDWLCPHAIGTEDPKAGDVWSDIDLGGCSPALDLPTGGLFQAPTWISGTFLREDVGLPFESSAFLNFELILRTLNDYLDPQFQFSTDNGLVVATTYVRNLTAGNLEVDLCSSSDDSSQVWVNDIKVVEVSACRPASGSCNELTPIVLPPGISKIAVLVWQGVGGWVMRVGLQHDGDILSDGNGLVEFLGTGAGDSSVHGQRTFQLLRSTFGQASPCGVQTATIELKGAIPPGFSGSDADPLTITETLEATDATSLQVTGVSNGGQVSDLISPGFNGKGFFLTWLLLGPYSQMGGNAPDPQDIRLDYLTDGLGIEESTIAPKAGDAVMTDYGGAAASTGLAYSTPMVNPGGIPTWRAIVDGDDTIDFNDYYGGDLDNILMYAFTYLELAQETEVHLGLASDDSVQVLIDGVEVHLRSVARRVEGPNLVQDVVSVGALAAGKHRVLVKVFEGLGEHGFRLRLQDPATGGPLTSGLALCLDPLQDPCTSSLLLGKTITWNVTRAQAVSGLSYTASHGGSSHALFSGRVEGEVPTQGLSTLLFRPASGGPVGVFDAFQDIGSPNFPGLTTFQPATGTYTITGSGEDIWINGDEFHFAFREVNGDFRATARITGMSGPATGRWGKTGLMARYSCDPASKYSFAMVPYRGEDPQTGDNRRHQSRRDHLTAGACRDEQVVPAGSQSHPYLGWLRLTRVGRYFFSEFADDVNGQPGPWVLAGGDTHVSPPDTLQVGFACCAHGSSGQGPLTVDIDQVTIEPFSLTPPVCFGGGAPLIQHQFQGQLPPSAVVTVGSGGHTPRAEADRLVLTGANLNNSAVSIFFPADDLLLGDLGFMAEFDFYCFTEGSQAPADGTTFAVFEGRSDAAPGVVGGVGGSLGYQEPDPNIIPLLRRKSFAVEIDTLENSYLFNDPPGAGTSGNQVHGYHVGIDFHQSVQSAQTNVEYGKLMPPLIQQPEGIHLQVIYAPLSPSLSLIQAWVRPGGGAASRSLVLSAFGPRLNGDVFLGFTGATGGLNSSQQLDNFVVRPLLDAGSTDCNANGTPDYCEVLDGMAPDCNGNSIPDACDLVSGAEADCNGNSIPDSCDISQGTSTDVNGNTIPDECETDVQVLAVPVTVDPAGSPDARTSAPVGAGLVVRGSTFWVEVWASDVGAVNTGLTGVFVDATFCGALLPTALFHGDRFTQFASGSIGGQGVDEFGGSKLPNGGGAAPEWVRVGWIEVTAGVEAEQCHIQLLPSATGVAAFTRGLIHPTFVDFGGADLEVVASNTNYDLDGDGRIGLGDLSLFAGSWLQAVPPALPVHDFDCDNFVGVGDLSWFATGWLKTIDDASITFPPCGGGGGGDAMGGSTGGSSGGGAVDVEFHLVALATPSPSDTALALPASLSQVDLGTTFQLEVWGSDIGSANTGFTSAYLDLAFPPGAVEVLSFGSSSSFDVFPSGSTAPGLVDELGGSALPGGKGIEPSWVRVAVVQMRALQPTSGLFALARSSSGVACLGRGAIPWAAVSLGSLTLSLGSGPAGEFRRGDSNADGSSDISDAVATLGWLFLGDEDLLCLDAADTDDSGEVDISDAISILGWLFLDNQEPPDPGPRSCGPDPTPDPLAPCGYPPDPCAG